MYRASLSVRQQNVTRGAAPLAAPPLPIDGLMYVRCVWQMILAAADDSGDGESCSVHVAAAS